MRRKAAWTSTRKKSQLFWGRTRPSTLASQRWRFWASRGESSRLGPHSISVRAMAAISTIFWSQSATIPQ